MNVSRVLVAWEPRSERLSALNQHVRSAMEWLRAIPSLAEGEWGAQSPQGKRMDCSDAQGSFIGLGRGGYPMSPRFVGSAQFYKQSFYLGCVQRWRARITVLCG